jgi:hypothetical protein
MSASRKTLNDLQNAIATRKQKEPSKDHSEIEAGYQLVAQVLPALKKEYYYYDNFFDSMLANDKFIHLLPVVAYLYQDYKKQAQGESSSSSLASSGIFGALFSSVTQKPVNLGTFVYFIHELFDKRNSAADLQLLSKHINLHQAQSVKVSTWMLQKAFALIRYQNRLGDELRLPDQLLKGVLDKLLTDPDASSSMFYHVRIDANVNLAAFPIDAASVERLTIALNKMLSGELSNHGKQEARWKAEDEKQTKRAQPATAASRAGSNKRKSAEMQSAVEDETAGKKRADTKAVLKGAEAAQPYYGPGAGLLLMFKEARDAETATAAAATVASTIDL